MIAHPADGANDRYHGDEPQPDYGFAEQQRQEWLADNVDDYPFYQRA